MIHHRYVAPFKGISVVCAVALVVLFGFAANFAQARGGTERTFVVSIEDPDGMLLLNPAEVTDTFRKNNPTHIEGNVEIFLDIKSLGITDAYNGVCANGPEQIEPISTDITALAGDWVVTVSHEIDALWMGFHYKNEAEQTFALQLLGEWLEPGLPKKGDTAVVKITQWTNRKQGGGAKRSCKVTQISTSGIGTMIVEAVIVEAE